MIESEMQQPKTRYEMPFLLLCGLGLSTFFVAVGSLGVFLLLVGAISDRSVSYSVAGHPATRAEFYRAAWPLLVFFPIVLLNIAGVAFTLWREDTRSRMLMLGYWVLTLPLIFVTSFALHEPVMWIADSLFAVVTIGLAWVYLYRKKNVVAYYEALQRGGRHIFVKTGQR